MFPLALAFAAIYALLLIAEFTDLLRGRTKRLWKLMRLPAAVLALAPFTVPLTGADLPGAAPYLPASPPALSAPAPAPAAPVAPAAPAEASPPPASGLLDPARAGEPGIYWYVHHYAKRYEVDPLLVLAIIEAESNFNPRAVSPRGAMGLMQINASTARYLGLRDPFDARENIAGGVRYLRELLERSGWSLHLALASYNAGPAVVQRYKGVPPYKETRRYIARVVRKYNRLRRADAAFRKASKRRGQGRFLVSSREPAPPAGPAPSAF